MADSRSAYKTSYHALLSTFYQSLILRCFLFCPSAFPSRNEQSAGLQTSRLQEHGTCSLFSLIPLLSDPLSSFVAYSPVIKASSLVRHETYRIQQKKDPDC